MFLNRKRSFTVAMLMLWLTAVPCFAENPIFYAGEKFDEECVPILAHRIFKVPNDKTSEAFVLLEKEPYVKLMVSELSQLFPHKKFKPESMIAKQAKQARDYAKSRERQAEDPFFKSSKQWMLGAAKEHYKFAAYTEKLLPELYPYLICAEAYNEKTGGFSAYLEGRTLRLQHGSLGSAHVDLKKILIVIFIEKEIEKIHVSASLAK